MHHVPLGPLLRDALLQDHVHLTDREAVVDDSLMRRLGDAGVADLAAPNVTDVVRFALERQAAALIRETWERFGGSAGALGAPIQPVEVVDRAFRQAYRGGSITIRSGQVEAIAEHQTMIRYTGIHCFGETRGPGDDEMYAFVSVYAPEQGDVDRSSIKVPDRDGDGTVNMNDGSSSSEGTGDIWRGPPQDLVLFTSLWEHDNSLPSAVKTFVDGAILAGIAAASLSTTGLGAIPITGLAALFVPEVTGWMAENLFGLGDDLIGNAPWPSPTRN
jgi:hypothetical protein